MNRSQKTRHIPVARSIKSRINETIRLIDQGRFEIPPKVDPIAFIQSDGKLRPAAQNAKPVSIRQLLKVYQDRLPSQAKEPNTVSLESTHIKYFLPLLPANKVAGAISSAELQRDVEKRLSKKHNGRFIRLAGILPDQCFLVMHFSRVGSRLSATLLFTLSIATTFAIGLLPENGKAETERFGNPHSLRFFNPALESEMGDNMKCLITDMDQDKACSR